MIAFNSTMLIERFIHARRDPSLAVLEGFHPLKHALRFHVDPELIVTTNRNRLEHQSRALATDIRQRIIEDSTLVTEDVFKQLAPVPPESGVIAIAKRRTVAGEKLLKTARKTPLILLENPSHMGNIGAVIRAAAAAGASGVIVVGSSDPWHPVALRGAAGLHFALPVGRLDTVPIEAYGPLIGVHPEGEPLSFNTLPPEAVLVFGSESRGLTPELLDRVEKRIAIPMAPGISSLNLATAVAITLYAWKLAH